MAKGVFIHNQTSVYDDKPAEYYHFPKNYLKRAERTVGDWIAYYESGKSGGRKSYTGVAKVAGIRPDPTDSHKYYADIVPRTFLPMERLVPFRLDGEIFETNLLGAGGKVNGGLAIAAMRAISDSDFGRIIAYGFPDEAQDLPRMDMGIDEAAESFAEAPADFVFDTPQVSPRETEKVLLNKKIRDRAFRSNVLRAYDKTCAFTGLRFINGGGRAEVQAAHIRPVEHDGPDSINNGLALSGTAHWMFDRGMLSLADDDTILVSRHINNIEEVDRLLVQDRKARLPSHPAQRPHKDYLSWHRQNCFKV